MGVLYSTAHTAFGVENVVRDDELCHKAMRDNYGATIKERCLFNPMCDFSDGSCVAKPPDENFPPLRKRLKPFPAANLLYKDEKLFSNGEGYTTSLLRH